MAINPSPLAQVQPSPTQQAAAIGQRAAELPQEPETQSMARNTMQEVAMQREKMNRVIERMIESRDRRMNLPFDPTLMAMASGFLKPTKTGSFGESMGYAAEAGSAAAEKEFVRQQAEDKLELELRQRMLESAQKGAGQELLQGMFPGVTQPTTMMRPPPATPGAAPGAPPGIAPGAGMPAAPTQMAASPAATLQPAISGMREVTLADIQLARQFADPDTVKFLETALQRQQDERKIGVQERGLEFTIPGTRRVIKNIPLPEQREALAVYQQSMQAQDPQMYFRYLVQKGWIEPEYAAAEPSGERTLLPPLNPAQEAGLLEREKLRAKADVEATDALNAAARVAGGVIRDTDQVIRFASDEKTKGAFGILAKPGVANSLLGLIATGVQTPKGNIGVPEIENALRKTLSSTEIDAAMFVLQPIANMELNFTRIYLQGQGAITQGEREVVRRLPPSLSDSPKVAIAKSEVLKARAVFDQERARMFRDYQRRNPRATLDDFADDREYKRLEKLYDDQLFKIQETYFPQSKPAGSSAGPIERSIRGNQ